MRSWKTLRKNPEKAKTLDVSTRDFINITANAYERYGEELKFYAAAKAGIRSLTDDEYLKYASNSSSYGVKIICDDAV